MGKYNLSENKSTTKSKIEIQDDSLVSIEEKKEDDDSSSEIKKEQAEAEKEEEALKALEARVKNDKLKDDFLKM